MVQVFWTAIAHRSPWMWWLHLWRGDDSRDHHAFLSDHQEAPHQVRASKMSSNKLRGRVQTQKWHERCSIGSSLEETKKRLRRVAALRVSLRHGSREEIHECALIADRYMLSGPTPSLACLSHQARTDGLSCPLRLNRAHSIF